MRIAIVSDIHGNLTAFEAVLAEYAQGESPAVSWTVEADLAQIAQWVPAEVDHRVSAARAA